MTNLGAKCLIAVMIALIISFLVLLLLTKPKAQYSLSVAHFNDYLSSYSATDKLGKLCEDTDLECYGGFSRMFAVLQQLKLQKNFLLFNVGNSGAGSLWFEVFNWNITVSLMNEIPIDAMSIAFHDFDDGLEVLKEAMKKIVAPVVLCNLDTSEDLGLGSIIRKSIIIERSKKKIGVIGVMSKFVGTLSNMGKLRVLSEMDSVEKEAETLLKNGVFTNILLSYGDYKFNQELAANLSTNSKIRLIIGGFTRNILYHGTTTAPVLVEGPYPTVIVNDDKNILCIHAGSKGMFIGNLTVIYDSYGDVIQWAGNPIFLDSKIVPDSLIVQKLKPNLEKVKEKAAKIIGSTEMDLDFEECLVGQCLIGSIFAEMMMFSRDGPVKGAMAMPHSFTGKIKKGDITYGDLWSMYSENDQVCTIDILGKHIILAWEESLTPENVFKERPYLSSHILLNISLKAPPGNRVIWKRFVDDLEIVDIEKEKKYTIVVNSYSLEGKKHLRVLRDYHGNKINLFRSFPAFLDVIKRRSPLSGSAKWKIYYSDPL